MTINYSPKTVTNGLVFCMDFASIKCYPGTGSNCTDLSNNFNGELINNPSYVNTSNNKYFNFNGTTNSRVIRIQNSTLLDTQTPSVEVWIRTNATTQGGFWFEKGTVNTQYSLFQESNLIKWRNNFTVGGFNSLNLTTSNFLSINKWAQIVGTFSSGNRKIYVNGSLVGSDSQTGTINTNSGGMSIGAYGGYSGSRDYYYNGDIAIVKIYNIQLTDGQVLQNYNALKGRFGL